MDNDKAYLYVVVSFASADVLATPAIRLVTPFPTSASETVQRLEKEESPDLFEVRILALEPGREYEMIDLESVHDPRVVYRGWHEGDGHWVRDVQDQFLAAASLKD